MKINKQLFEDVLSGKLKGTFVLKNKQIAKSNTLKRSCIDNFPYEILINYGNGVTDYGIYKSNGDFESYSTSYFDIIDFIPDTDIKEDELTIEIPDGKIVDWDESKKQNKIVLKDKQLTYNDIIKDILEKHQYEYISPNGELFLTSHIHKCLEAKNKLTTVAKYLNGGWKPKSGDIVTGLVLEGKNRNIRFSIYCWDTDKYYFPQFAFKSQKLAQQTIEILGEETVKLALEPLGI